MTRCFVPILLWPIALMVSGAAFAQQQTTYDGLIGTIVGLIQAGKVDEAASKAIDAVTIAPERYDGHLYLGVARFRQNAVADAEKSLTRALDLAPPDRKARVREALELVTNTRHFAEYMATAESGEREGARAKAARSYASAWRLFPDRADVASKALQGFVAIGDHFEAARIWNALTDEQRAQYTKAFGSARIDAREVKNENDRRLVALQEAIRAGTFDRATELATPMAEADVANYGPVAAALAFLRADRATAFRLSRTLTPEQLIRMDLFSEAQMNQMVGGSVFGAYLEDVVGGNREHRVQTVREAISRPRLELERKAAASKLEADTRTALAETFRELDTIFKTLGPRKDGNGRLKQASGEPYLTEGFQVEYSARSQPSCSGWDLAESYLGTGAGRGNRFFKIVFADGGDLKTFGVGNYSDGVAIRGAGEYFRFPHRDLPIATKIADLLNDAAKDCWALARPTRP